MAWNDLETVIGGLGTIFGNTQAAVFILGTIVFLFFIALAITLNIGFEASAIFLTLLMLGEIQAGILPQAFMIIVYLGGGLVFLSFALNILKR